MSDDNKKEGIKSLENIDGVAIRELINGSDIRKRSKDTKRSKHNHQESQVKFLRYMGLLPNSHLKMVIQV
jgi:hypothetical protein